MNTPSAVAPLPVLAQRLRAALPGRDALRAWDHLGPRFIARGYLPDADGWKAFFALCAMWQLHVDIERLARRGRHSERVQRTVADARVRMRARAAEWYLLPVARVPLAQVSARGEDVELRKLFMPPRRVAVGGTGCRLRPDQNNASGVPELR
jgi:hypothetical protein